SAALHHALGLATALAEQGRTPETALAEKAPGYFERALACDPNHVMAGLNLAEALAQAGQKQCAIDQARRTLDVLSHLDKLSPDCLNAGHFPLGFDLFRVEWERAAWSNAGQPAAEARAKADLIRWRLQSLLGNLTGAPHHYYEAAALRPDLPVTRAALGCALARAGQFAAAV